jgi:hypothetical protein
MLRYRLFLGTLLVGSLSCGSGESEPAGPKYPGPTVSIAQLKTSSDTIDATLAVPLIVEIRDPETGALKAGADVRFSAIDGSVSLGDIASGTFATTLIGTTNASGRASAVVRLGRKIGRQRIVVTGQTVPGADTANVDINPGHLVALRIFPGDTAVVLQGTASHALIGLDRASDTVSTVIGATFSASPSFVCSVDAAGAVRGLGYGDCSLQAAVGALNASARVGVLPPATLLVRRANTLGTSSIDGTGFTKVADVDTTTIAPWIEWLSSGAAVAFLEKEGTQSRMAILNLDGTKRTFAPLPFPLSRHRISGDGQWISVLVPTRSPFTAGVERIRQDGTGVQVVADSCCLLRSAVTAIAPDGGRVFWGDEDKGWIATFVGGRGVNVGRVTDARFSPDGSQLAIAIPNGLGYLVLQPVDGSPQKIIAGDVTGATIAGWTSDSKWILLGQNDGSFNVSWRLVSTSGSGPMIRLPASIGSRYVVVSGPKP